MQLYLANYDGFCTYAHNENNGNPWTDTDGHEWAYVIQTADGVVDTPSYEGYREAVDDIRYATKLQLEIARQLASSDPKARGLAKNAREWLDAIHVDMVGYDPKWIRWQMVDKNVSAGPAAMREEYEKHPERYVRDRRVTVSVILLKPEDAGKRSEISKALASEPFADLARRYSSDARAADGGQWKDIKPEDAFNETVCAEIAKMPKGTISHWIEIGGWSFLLRKDDESEGGKMSFADAYDEVEAAVRREAAERLLSEWLERLRSETYIKVY